MEARQYVSQLGIDVKKVEEIQRRYAAEASSEVARAIHATEEAPYVDIDPAAVPTPAHNPWEWRKPPYEAQGGSQWSNGTRGTRTVSHTENRVTGQLTSYSTMRISGADDSDNSNTTAYSEFRFWFRMPAAGLIEVWLYMQSIECSYSGWLGEEWGVSDASIQQHLRPYLWILNPAGSYPKFSSLLNYLRGDDPGSWSAIIAPTGAFRYAHLFSPAVYAAGQWVLCGVGIRNDNYFWVNDMSCEDWISSDWFFQQVAVRSTGAP
jgi:hypothetical protein